MSSPENNTAGDAVTIHDYRKFSAHVGTGYGSHWDTLSLREARSGTNAVKYTAKVPAGFKGSL